MLALIWAQARDDSGRPVIGSQGRIPWDVPEDLVHFREHTLGHPVIMGYGTWESLNKRPLKGRSNIFFTGSVDRALAEAAQCEGSEIVWVIGGGETYRQFMDRADELVVTDIDLIVAGDTFAPTIDPAEWVEVKATEWRTSRKGTRYQFRTFERVPGWLSLSKPPDDL